MRSLLTILWLFATASLHAGVLPSAVPNLVLWLDSTRGVITSGANVLSWTDQQSGFVCYPRTVGANPTTVTSDAGIRNRTTMNFSGGSLTNTGSSVISGNTDRTVLVCAQPFQSPQADIIFAVGLAGTCSGIWWGTTDTTIYACSVNDVTGLNTFGNNGGSAYQVMTSQLKSDKVNRWSNTTQVDNTVNSNAINSPAGFVVGDWGNFDRHYVKKVSEILVYSRALSAPEISSLVDYLLNGRTAPNSKYIPDFDYNILWLPKLFRVCFLETNAWAIPQSCPENDRQWQNQHELENIVASGAALATVGIQTPFPTVTSFPTLTPTLTPQQVSSVTFIPVMTSILTPTLTQTPAAVTPTLTKT